MSKRAIKTLRKLLLFLASLLDFCRKDRYLLIQKTPHDPRVMRRSIVFIFIYPDRTISSIQSTDGVRLRVQRQVEKGSK